MTELHNFDLSRHTPLDKANFFFEFAIDCANKDDQFYYLLPSLAFAQKAGLAPVDFLIDKITKLPINYIDNATNNTGAGDTEDAKECTGGCDTGCADGCKSKISLSLIEILERYRGDAGKKSYTDNW